MKVADTQCVLWLAHDIGQITPLALLSLREAMRTQTLAISDITLSEISHLVQRNRVSILEPLDVFLRFVESRYRVLPITAAIAERAHGFGKAYPGDPADRIIGATSVVHAAPLITSDSLIRASGEVDCIW